MSPRSIRRAQEHKARKLAYKAEKALQRNRDCEEAKTHSADLIGDPSPEIYDEFSPELIAEPDSSRDLHRNPFPPPASPLAHNLTPSRKRRRPIPSSPAQLRATARQFPTLHRRHESGGQANRLPQRFPPWPRRPLPHPAARKRKRIQRTLPRSPARAPSLDSDRTLTHRGHGPALLAGPARAQSPAALLR